jgi:hypothetical protein
LAPTNREGNDGRFVATISSKINERITMGKLGVPLEDK